MSSYHWCWRQPRVPVGRIVAALLLCGLQVLIAQTTEPPRLRAKPLAENITIDGVLNEPVWASADRADTFAQVDPIEGAAPSARTAVQVLASTTTIVIGITCDDPEADKIVSYDGLVNPGGETDNPDWDGIWEAATARTPAGWSVELSIPVQTLGFKRGLHEWHFNVQRRIQRRLETDRWAFPARQYQITQTSRAGLLTELPDFNLGLGLTVRPAITTGGDIPAPAASVDGEFQPSLDLNQRLGANVLASGTINTDFAETEVDTRRTNLTRFPLFFPEKRTFFLEGDDIFSFGLGLEQDILPYFSRRIGLVGDQEVPIIAGGKVNGRIHETNFGGLIVGTNDKTGVVDDEAVMAVGRVKRNLWRESWVGAIATAGDPLGRRGSWLAGADFTYATSRFRSNKNFLVGVWGLATGREDLGRDATAYGVKIDYPNDLWDVALVAKRIGKDFDPSLGFVPRPAVYLYNLGINSSPRLAHGPIQQMFFEFEPSLATDLDGRWESYRVFCAPINWRFRSGDRVEFNINPTGERLVEPFVVDGVTIAPGDYHWRQYRLEAGTAQKRRFYTQLTWWFGGFYDGELDQYEWTGAWNPVPLVTLEFTGERDIGRLPSGSFTQTLIGNQLRLNISPDLSISSYVQYDTETNTIGTNTRLRWTFKPAGDLFIVYNHNLRSVTDRWQFDSNQLLVKVQYAFRY